MKRLLVERDPSVDAGTFGSATLFDDAGDHLAGPWHSLEPPWRDNKPNISCIPDGVYTAELIHSPRFDRELYRLKDVPERSNAEIHPANWGGDEAKGLYTELHGCTALGMGVGRLTPPGGSMAPQQAITSSKQAIAEFMAATEGDPEIEVEYRWTR